MPCVWRFALCGWSFCGCTDVVTFVEIRGLRSLLVLMHCTCLRGRASPFTDSITGTTNRKRSAKHFQCKTNPISRDCTTNAKHMFIGTSVFASASAWSQFQSETRQDDSRSFKSTHTPISRTIFVFKNKQSIHGAPQKNENACHHAKPLHMSEWHASFHTAHGLETALARDCSDALHQKRKWSLQQEAKNKKNKTAVVVTAALFNMHTA